MSSRAVVVLPSFNSGPQLARTLRAALAEHPGKGSKFVTDLGAIQQLSFKKLSRIFAPPFLAQ